MIVRGHHEPADAFALRQEPASEYRTAPLDVVPLDLGPSTVEEAKSCGFGGSTFPIDAGGVGILISRDPAFDVDANDCQRDLDDRYPDFRALRDRAAELSGQMRAEFVENLTPRIKEALLERFSCVRARGYPGIIPNQALQVDDLTEVLEMAGVEPGHETTQYLEPSEADVPAGEVQVFPSEPVRTYEPSDEEIQFSLNYVECAFVTGFWADVRAGIRTARSRTATKFTAEIDRVANDLDALSAAVRSGSDQLDE